MRFAGTVEPARRVHDRDRGDSIMKYRMEDGTVVDTDRASASWREALEWDGRNQISKATGRQWDHQRLYRSRNGRYYIESWSEWQGSRDHAEWVSPEEAARWLLINGRELPHDLLKVVEEVTE